MPTHPLLAVYSAANVLVGLLVGRTESYLVEGRQVVGDVVGAGEG
jgi:hypothetical protein